MPYLSIQTNKELEEKEQSRLLAEASKIVAAKLNKPEKYVMVAWTAAPKMIFDNDPNGAAFLELQSIGIPEASRQELACRISQMCRSIPRNRRRSRLSGDEGRTR